MDMSLITYLRKREDKILSKYAINSYSDDVVRRIKEEEKNNIRPEFSRDADRIIHSFCYTRYIDKTQVFYRERDKKNDRIAHRVIHVQLLSKIGRFIGRCLGLNEDLIEAISLGHDVGHCPYGHVGEKALSEIYHKYSKEYYFHHNLQSIIFLDRLERREVRKTGKNFHGLNLTLQTLDGILCHNGELNENKIAPDKNKSTEKDFKKRWEIFDEEVEKVHSNDKDIKIFPMTFEGCVVRLADTISYIGRDIEDAISLGYIKREEIPETILGNNNRKILDTLIKDMIKESYGKDYVGYSNDVFNALKELKKFNYEKIYENEKVRGISEKIYQKIETLFKYYMEIMNENEKEIKKSRIYKDHIKLIGEWYYKENYEKPYIIVKDYIAGMTDRYFNDRYEEI